MLFPERENDNREMKQFILDRLAIVEYTHDYVFAIREKGMVKAAEVENAHEIMPYLTYCERNASSHGSEWGVRMWNKIAVFDVIKEYASDVWPICSVREFEDSYQKARKTKIITGNHGNWFEHMFVKYVGGQRADSQNTKCTESGDVILNGKHLQLKLWNATVIVESQVNRFYAEYLAKQSGE